MCTPTKRRYFWKCWDCLTPVAVESDLRRHDPKCGACGGEMWFMGRVERGRIVTDGTRCACDERCTAATGPNCECSCGGENHGTGRVVEVTFDQGGAPTIRTPDTAECRRIADEWRITMRPLRAERDRIRRAKCAGWIDSDTFNRGYQLTHGIDYCAGLTSHKGRMAAARSLADKFSLSV